MSAPTPTPDQPTATLESRVQTFRDAVLEDDATAADDACEALVGYLWDPKCSVSVTRAIFELSRAMNEAPSRAIRTVIQAHQVYALESLAERVLELAGTGAPDDGGGEAEDAADGGNDNIAKAAASPASEAVQRAA